jgi:ArsR family transcriptional regulator
MYTGGMEDLRIVNGLKALADPARLRILEFLLRPAGDCCARDDGVCGCDFEDLLGLSQPTVSHHLKVLVQAGLLSAEKRGRWTYYDLEPEALGELSAYLGRFAVASRQRTASATA